jgi:integrase
VSATQANADRFVRYTTRHRGVFYRLRSDGGRTYYVHAAGRFTRVEGGEAEALARRTQLRGGAVHPFSALAEEWLASKRKLRRSTRERYRGSLDLWLLPRLGDLELAQVTVDRVAELVVEMEAAGASAGSILNHLKPLSGTVKFAMRKGLISRNPVALLTVDERPRSERREMRILEPAEIATLLAASADRANRKHAKYDYTPLLRTAIFSGLRLGELLGLEWRDLDEVAGTLDVRRQVTPYGEITEPKTARARRRVVIAPELARLLEGQRRLARRHGHGRPESFVFASNVGGPLSSRNVVNRGFHPAVRDAKLDRPGKPKLRFHDLRHCYASMMVAQGLSSADVAAQLGHANSGITERIYIHQFNTHRTHERLRHAAELAMAFGASSESLTSNPSLDQDPPRTIRRP